MFLCQQEARRKSGSKPQVFRRRHPPHNSGECSSVLLLLAWIRLNYRPLVFNGLRSHPKQRQRPLNTLAVDWINRLHDSSDIQSLIRTHMHHYLTCVSSFSLIHTMLMQGYPRVGLKLRLKITLACPLLPGSKHPSQCFAPGKPKKQCFYEKTGSSTEIGLKT